MNAERHAAEDPLSLIGRTRTWLHSQWLSSTYPFAGYGKKVSIHYSCDVLRSIAPHVKVGDNVYLAPDVWLNVAPGSEEPNPKIVLGNGCAIGRRSSISARNFIELEENVLFAPGVFVMDHNHEFAEVRRPILAQGVTAGGKITIEKNCWLGYSAVVLCGKGELRIGQNSVIGAHSVVTQSVPPFSVVVGSPARIVKSYDPDKQLWVKASDKSLGTCSGSITK
jgi:acetyltransferase-like isoleucine patch superfamily enzyme